MDVRAGTEIYQVEKGNNGQNQKKLLVKMAKTTSTSLCFSHPSSAEKEIVAEGDWKPSTPAPNRRDTPGDKATTLEETVKKWDQLVQALVLTKTSLFQPS